MGGSIETTGAGAQGVRVGSLSSGAPFRVAPIHMDDGTDEGFVDGHRRQTVTVNGAVMSAAEGVFLAGGGRVVIGRRGSIALGVRDRDSRDGHGAGTTIAVNGVVLHDGETGVTGHRASNGAWNVMMREEGVNVTDYTTDPANWVESDLAVGVAADRDFSVQDFNERRKTAAATPTAAATSVDATSGHGGRARVWWPGRPGGRSSRG